MANRKKRIINLPTASEIPENAYLAIDSVVDPEDENTGAKKVLVSEVAGGGGGGGTTVVANPQGSATANLNKVQIGSTIYSVGGLEIIDTLEAGETELTISNNAITTTATYDFFTDAFGVSPTDVEVTAGQIVLTFEEQESDVSVKVRIS